MRDLQSITDMQKTYLDKMLEPNSQFSIFLDVTAEAINWPEEFKGLSLNVNNFPGLIPKIAHFIIIYDPNLHKLGSFNRWLTIV